MKEAALRRLQWRREGDSLRGHRCAASPSAARIAGFLSRVRQPAGLPHPGQNESQRFSDFESPSFIYERSRLAAASVAERGGFELSILVCFTNARRFPLYCKWDSCNIHANRVGDETTRQEATCNSSVCSAGDKCVQRSVHQSARCG
jgi:hypothetical protein